MSKLEIAHSAMIFSSSPQTSLNVQMHVCVQLDGFRGQHWSCELH